MSRLMKHRHSPSASARLPSYGELRRDLAKACRAEGGATSGGGQLPKQPGRGDLPAVWELGIVDGFFSSLLKGALDTH
jgi:hypothetical protein